ncbi:MAG: glycosyltransferase family 39 protein [Acidobacteriaceae bacterium]
MEAVREHRLAQSPFFSARAQYTVYALALAVSLSTWFIVIRAPLWLDETVSFRLIQGGFHGILSRQVWPDSPVYSCLLWLWTQAVGTREVVLRISSLLPMLAAVYLLYKIARQLFPWDVAVISVIVFCLHPIVIFAAIDVRPYAFAALALNATILALVHLRRNDSSWLAAVFGLLAASVVEFQLLFAAILPALLLCLLAAKAGNRKVLWRQFGIALVAFAIAIAPVIPRFEAMMHTSGTHVFSAAPRLMQLISTVTVRGLVIVLLIFLAVAAFRRKLDLRGWDSWTVLVCTSLALVPILILYGLSVGTSVHVFVPRYRLVAVPGIALCWGLVVSRIDSRNLRLLFCALLVAVAAIVCFTSRSFHRHQYSWKYALALAEKNAAPDNAPVLIASDLPEADHMRMPEGAAIEASGILPQLTYYKLTVPVIAMPRALNQEAMRAGSDFLQQAEQRHQRFLAMAFVESFPTLNWLRQKAAGFYDVRELGTPDGVRVLEFTPRN